MRAVIAGLAAVLALSGCGTNRDTASTDDPVEHGDVAPRAAAPTADPDSPDADNAIDDDRTATPADPHQGTRPQQSTPKPKRDTAANRQPSSNTRRYRVLEVVDGDTVKVDYHGGVSVRVIGIDTPETVHPGVPDECWGPVASTAAENLLTGQAVGLTFDPTQGRRDAYRRTLAYLHIPGVGDFGQTMIKRGHAIEYTYDRAYRHQASYRHAENEARAADRGLWEHCGGADTPMNEPTQEPEPQRHQMPTGDCAASYDPCVPPYPPDVDCGDVDGPIRVTGEDPHGLDGGGDGIACES